MDIEGKINSIIGKAEDKADWIAGILGAWERFNGDIGRIIDHYTRLDPKGEGVATEVLRTLSNWKLLTYKLLQSPHVYTTEFKVGLGLYLASEFGLIPAKHKKTAEKILWGSGLAALTLPGSGEEVWGGGAGFNSNSPTRGI
jgi:hypothetical protein